MFLEGPPSVDFAIDSGVGMGIVYILSIERFPQHTTAQHI